MTPTSTAAQDTKHTPGPWTRKAGERFKHDESAGVQGPDGMYVATALDFNRSVRDVEVEANARLIAAAPELLEALREIQELVSDDDKSSMERLDAAHDIAMEAIDKAEGRES